jgi:hypothetical protein
MFASPAIELAAGRVPSDVERPAAWTPKQIACDDDIVTADIVTVDDSLVQRVKIDRHSGAIDDVD